MTVAMAPNAASNMAQLVESLDFPPAAYDAMMAEVARAVAELELAAAGAHYYSPRGAMREIQTMEDPEIVLDGPAGTGKSRGVLQKIHACMLRYRGARALIAGVTRKSLSESALFTFEQFVLRSGNPVLGSPGPSRQHRDKYAYPNGSEIVVGGLDNPDRVMGSEYDLIYVPQAEQITQDERDVLNSRLRAGVMPYQQLLMDCNPSYPTHWIKQLADAGKLLMLPTRHVDNPKLWNVKRGVWTTFGRAYMERLERLSGVRYQRLVLGKWVKAEGAVYEEWDRAVHICKRFDVPLSWPRFLSVDFGFINPLVCQWWTLHPDGRLIMYRELYVTETLVEEAAAQIAAHSKGERFRAVITDHDAEDRKTLEKHLRVRTTPARKPVLRGIQAVQSRLKVRRNGRPGLQIMEGSLIEQDPKLVENHLPTSTLDEVEGYIWKKAGNGLVKKEEPVGVDDHGMDTMRYVVASLDLKPVRRERDQPASGSRANF